MLLVYICMFVSVYIFYYTYIIIYIAFLRVNMKTKVIS